MFLSRIFQVDYYVYYATHLTNVVVVVVCFRDLKFCLSSQLKPASCARCSSEMLPSKQVNEHSFTQHASLLGFTALAEWRGDVTPLMHDVAAWSRVRSELV